MLKLLLEKIFPIVRMRDIVVNTNKEEAIKLDNCRGEVEFKMSLLNMEMRMY